MPTSTPAPAPARAKLIAAFLAVYVIWGSTYLSIRFAVETIPALLMGGSRLLVAGAILHAWAIRQGATRPTRGALVSGIISGLLMLTIGNGAVVWSEQTVPSGIASLLVATVPLWMVVLDWLRPRGRRPATLVLLGVAAGLVGLAVLVGPDALRGAGPVSPVGAIVLILGALSWAIGSLVVRERERATSPMLGSAIQMYAGGLGQLVLGAAMGEVAHFDASAISLVSALNWVYLVTFGSVVGFTAYVWLLRVTTPANAATYAYVNPVVAVFLGWLFANEPVTSRTLIASAVILGAVALITRAKK